MLGILKVTQSLGLQTLPILKTWSVITMEMPLYLQLSRKVNKSVKIVIFTINYHHCHQYVENPWWIQHCHQQFSTVLIVIAMIIYSHHERCERCVKLFNWSPPIHMTPLIYKTRSHSVRIFISSDNTLKMMDSTMSSAIQHCTVIILIVIAIII